MKRRKKTWGAYLCITWRFSSPRHKSDYTAALLLLCPLVFMQTRSSLVATVNCGSMVTLCVCFYCPPGRLRLLVPRRRRRPGSQARVTGQETRQFLPLRNKSNTAFPDINDTSFTNTNTHRHRLIQQNTPLEYEKPQLYHANTGSYRPLASLRLS